MKWVNWLFAVVMFAFFTTAFAQEPEAATTQDLPGRLQAELDTYKNQIETLRGQPLIDVADLITGSGLNDSTLYVAVETKLNSLIAEHRAKPKDKLVAEEVNAMMRTLGSMNLKSEAVINNLLQTSTSRGIRNRAVRLLPKLVWFHERNLLMQKPDFYEPGQDLMTHRYLNLIISDDPRNSRWAAEEIYRRGGAEPVVYRKMAEILAQQQLAIKDDVHLDSLAWFCKILATYDAANSAELLSSIRTNPRTDKKLKKYAKVK